MGHISLISVMSIEIYFLSHMQVSVVLSVVQGMVEGICSPGNGGRYL